LAASDFNFILDPDLDGSGGKPKLKESCKKIENLCSSFDLIDIWRIRNPGDKPRFLLETEKSSNSTPSRLLGSSKWHSRRGREG